MISNEPVGLRTIFCKATVSNDQKTKELKWTEIDESPHKFPHYSNLEKRKKCRKKELNRSLLAEKRAFRRLVSLVFLLSFRFTLNLFFPTHIPFRKPFYQTECWRKHIQTEKNFLKFFSTLSPHAFNFSFSWKNFFRSLCEIGKIPTPKVLHPTRVETKFIRRFSSN